MQPEHWLYTVPLQLRSLFHGAQADQELDEGCGVTCNWNTILPSCGS
jgi:hypothetical protein